MALGLVTALLAVATAATGLAVGSGLIYLGAPVVALVSVLVGVLVSRSQPGNPVGWLLLGVGSGLAIADAGMQSAIAGAPGGRWLAWVSTWSRPSAVYCLLVLVPLHFPDGLPEGAGWRRLRVASVGTIAAVAGWFAVRPGAIQGTEVPNPLGVSALIGVQGLAQLLTVGSGLAMVLVVAMSLVHRYRRGDRTRRSQLKWIAYAGAMWVALVLLSWPAAALDPSLVVVVELLLVVAGAGLPVAIGVAVLRHRLYDVDLLISRTLVYGALTVAVVALYVVVVGYLGALLQARGSLLVSLLATGVVAVGFSPLRERLQQASNRLVYGDREDPYAVLERLGRRLDAAASPQELLDLATAEVADAVRMRYAAVESATPTGPVIVAEHGQRPRTGKLERIHLQAGGGNIGWLAFGPLREVEELLPADRRLLEALSRPVGATLHARGLAADLQRSREALVTAREEERSRLHRDLHDGLGPELATVSMLAEAARDTAGTDPARTEALLDDLIERAQQAVMDLRGVVHALRPPALDALGLAGALHAYLGTHTKPGLDVVIDVSEPLPPLPPAVEVAAYRIVTEAITNVGRHAAARTCRLRLAIVGDRLELEVVDDGLGLATDHTPGIGLTSMQARAAELGGHCTVTASPTGGTTVAAWLPLAPHLAVDGELTSAPST